MTEDLHLPRNMKKVQSLHGGTPRIWLKIVVSMIHNPGFVLSHCDKTQFNSEIDDLINCNSYQWFNIICKWFRSLKIQFRVLFVRRHRNGDLQSLMWQTFSNTVICWVYTNIIRLWLQYCYTSFKIPTYMLKQNYYYGLQNSWLQNADYTFNGEFNTW